MSMFKECLIHLCNCTWLNVLYILNHMLIKHKKIFEFFLVGFGNCLRFKKFQKIQKFSTLPFGDSLSWVMPVVRPVASLLRRFHDSLASETSNCEKHLKKFSKFLVLAIFATHFRDYITSRSPVASLFIEVCNSLASGCPSCEKDLC